MKYSHIPVKVCVGVELKGERSVLAVGEWEPTVNIQEAIMVNCDLQQIVT